jgi:hypothetical protein
MRRSDVTAILFLLSCFMPLSASAQQTMPDANQASPQARPEAMPQQPQQIQTQKAPVQPERTPQQSDQARDSDRQRAEDTRINRDWTTRQQRGEDRMWSVPSLSGNLLLVGGERSRPAAHYMAARTMFQLLLTAP